MSDPQRLLLTAAGTGKILGWHGAWGALPLEYWNVDVRIGYRSRVILVRCHDNRTALGATKRCFRRGRYSDLTFVIGDHGENILCRRAGSGRRSILLATPIIGCRIGVAGIALNRLGDAGTTGRRRQNHFGDFCADCVVLVSGQRNRSQDTDDRDHDHQFDQGKTLLQRTFHGKLLGLKKRERRLSKADFVPACLQGLISQNDAELTFDGP